MASSSDRNGTGKTTNTQRRTTSSSGRSGSSNSSGARNGARRTTSGTSSSANSSKRRAKVMEPEYTVLDEIILILAFAIVIFLFLCTVGIIGAKKGADPNFGDYVQAFMLGVFGYTAYVVPIITVASMAMKIYSRPGYAVWFRIGSLIALVTVVGILLHMISYGDLEAYADMEGWVKTFYKEGKGGGVVFGALALLLCSFIGKAGTVFLLIIVTIIALIIFTGKSFLRTIKSGSKKLYETTREEGGRLREMSSNVREEMRNARFEHEENAESEEKFLRRNRRVSGVTMNTFLGATSSQPEMNQAEAVEEKLPQPIKSAQPVLPLADLEPVKEEPVVKKESNDIHQIEYKDNGEDDWIRPVSVRKAVTEDEDIIKPIRVKETQEIKPVSTPVDMEPLPVVKEDEDVKHTKPVAHLRSRDKSDMSASLDRPVKELMTPPKTKKEYKFPPIHLLARGEGNRGGNDVEDMAATAKRLEETLETFGVRVKVTDYSKGPAVTRYELHPEQGVKVSRILSLADDIKLNLAASDIRIEAPIPGKMAVGIEVPNKNSSAVHLRELLDNQEFKNFPSNLAFAVGKDIGGQLVVTDIAKMPHVLIAGATGSGKSVCINTLIMSILYKAHPDDVKMIMIDPKVVELNVYNGIPHLMIPVVTDPKKASAALAWGVAEMTERYKKFADAGVRDLKGYNQKAESGSMDEDGQPMKKMPQIVIIVDELADLMMVASKEVEESICRLAQLARAAGIHLIIATQRPSVDVITGLIKANMPSRIAFSVSSGIDSRTILDANGAEKLLGKGDMLFFPQGYSKPARVQGAFVSDKEVSDVVDFIKNQSIANDYGDRIEETILNTASSSSGSLGGGDDEYDTYFAEAGRFVIEKEKGSIGMLQRVFKIGFNRAARIMDQLEEAGVVGPEEGTKPRRILMSLNEFENYLNDR